MRARTLISSQARRAPLALIALGLLWCPALGCSDGDPIGGPVDGASSAEVLGHWEALLEQAEGPLGARWSDHGTPEVVYGAMSAPFAEISGDAARSFLSEHAPLFRMDRDLGDLVLSATSESPLGHHFTFQQRVQGVPVHGAEVKVHFNRDGRVIALANGYVPDIALGSVDPALAPEDAVEVARATTGVDAAADDETTSHELVVLATGGAAALAYRVVVAGDGPTWQVFVDAETGAPLGAPEDVNRYWVNGTAQVYKVNAIVATQNNGLTDGNDAASAVPSSAYITVTLQGLSGTGYLDGQFASSADSSGRAFSASNSFVYTRNSHGFSEAMGYYYLDYAERYIQSLGFTNVNNRQQVFAVNKYKKDNSFYTPSTKKISYGLGGVDDAEDAEVILHEYGHSIQDDQVPGFGSSAQAGAMGEGFGDYWAASVGAQLSGGFQDACVAEWDAVSYSSTNPPCLRRVDGTKHYPQNYVGQVHSDGEMWSAALWQIRSSIGAAQADKVILQAHFLTPANGTFSDGSNALVTAAQNLGYTATEVSAIRTILQNRGFTVTV